MPMPMPMADDDEMAEGESSNPLDEVEDSAASEMADIIGIEAEKIPAFKVALEDFVSACVKQHFRNGKYTEQE